MFVLDTFNRHKSIKISEVVSAWFNRFLRKSRDRDASVYFGLTLSPPEVIFANIV